MVQLTVLARLEGEQIQSRRASLRFFRVVPVGVAAAQVTAFVVGDPKGPSCERVHFSEDADELRRKPIIALRRWATTIASGIRSRSLLCPPVQHDRFSAPAAAAMRNWEGGSPTIRLNAAEKEKALA